MRLAGIIAPFGLIAVLFSLPYLSGRDSGSGSFLIMLMGIGILVAIAGIAAVYSNK